MLDKKTVSQCISADYCRGWNDAVDAIPRWISVEERLPEDCRHVLVFMRRNFVAGWSTDYWHIDTDWLDDGNWSKHPAGGYYNITHWMPLPEPPKEEHK